MSKSTPSLLALLGLVAFAGYQNRDRITDMLDDARNNRQASGGDPTTEQGGFLSEIGKIFQPGTETAGLSGTSNPNSGLSGALRDLKERFTSNSQGDAADSWISTEANRPLNIHELESALGHETLDELAHKTGLTRQELLLRLNAALPEVVNQLTPDGHLPSDNALRTAL